MYNWIKKNRLTYVLAAGVLGACLAIGWLIYNKSEVVTAIKNNLLGGIPNVTYLYTIGGDGSEGPYQLSEPMGVDISEKGEIYVADTLNNTVKVFDKVGNFIRSIGNKENLYLPTDVAVNSTGIYVTESKNSRVQLFSGQGDLQKTFIGPEMNAKIGALMPVAIAVDHTDAVYLTDVFYQRVIAVNKKAELLFKVGQPGNADAGLLYPNGIAVDEKNNLIYVADSNNGLVKIFDKKAKFKGSLKTDDNNEFFNMPRGLAFSNGILFVTETFGHNIKVLAVKGTKITASSSFGNRGLDEEEMNFPNDVAVKGNRLCIADRANDRVLVYEISW